MIVHVVLRRRPPQFRLCNLCVPRLLNSKVELEAALFAWDHFSSFARGQVHLAGGESQEPDCQTEKLRDPCFLAPPRCHRCATTNYQNRQPVGTLGIQGLLPLVLKVVTGGLSQNGHTESCACQWRRFLDRLWWWRYQGWVVWSWRPQDHQVRAILLELGDQSPKCKTGWIQKGVCGFL